MSFDSNQISCIFDGISNTEKECVFWAMGGVTADLWYDAVIESGYKTKYKVDKYKAGQFFRDEILLSPGQVFSEIVDRNAYTYIVFTIDPIRLTQIKKELIAYGIDPRNIIACSTAHYYMHREEIESLYDRLEDEESKRQFVAFLRCRMFGELIPESSMIRGLQYFSVFEFQKLDMNEIFVDAGAYVGDTLEKFLFEKFGTFKKYYAFEPYKDSYCAMNYRLERLKKEWSISDDKIIIENKALDLKNGNAVINDTLDPVGVVVEETADVLDTDARICTIRLDDYFAEKEYTTLKADIEGKEMDMLKGGELTIKKYGVKLAISVYHRPWDIISIPSKISEINGEYRFKFRCHMQDGADSILYAYL